MTLAYSLPPALLPFLTPKMTAGSRPAWPSRNALVGVNAMFLGAWTDLLRPVRSTLTPWLASIFKDTQRSDSERSLATNVLSDYAGDDASLLAELLMAADAKAYQKLFPLVQEQRAETLPLLEAELQKKANPAPSETNPEQVKDRLAERQARAAVALFRMGKAEEVLLRLVHSPDPRLRSFIINWLNPLGADPTIVGAELERSVRSDSAASRRGPAGTRRVAALPATGGLPSATPQPQLMDAILFDPDSSIRRALILAVGTYGTERFSSSDLEPLVATLLDLYHNDPDAGIHGAAEWTLRQWKQDERLKNAQAELRKLLDKGPRRWFVNSQGQTFAVINGPVEFRMGSLPGEPERDAYETPHLSLIPRRFAIADKEVTVEQYQLREGEPAIRHRPELSRQIQPRSQWSHDRRELVWRGGLLQLAEQTGGLPREPVVLLAQ